MPDRCCDTARHQLAMVGVGIAGMTQPTQAGFKRVPLPLKRLTQGLKKALIYTTFILHVDNDIYIYTNIQLVQSRKVIIYGFIHASLIKMHKTSNSSTSLGRPQDLHFPPPPSNRRTDRERLISPRPLRPCCRRLVPPAAGDTTILLWETTSLAAHGSLILPALYVLVNPSQF